MRIRMANITTQCEWYVDGEKHTLTEDDIKLALAHKTVRRCAYIKHDKDVVTEYDVINDRTETLKPSDIGTKKKEHWHIVLELKTATELDNIAKWFGVAPNFVDVPKGRDAFIDCVQYLTHERDEQQELGKQLYEDKEVRANFDFRQAISEYQVKQAKYGRTLDASDEILYEIIHNGMTLSQAVDTDRIAYMKNFSKYKQARADYLARQKAPNSRINYYVYGKGGVGKGLLSRALARSLYPQLEDSDCFFEVGAPGSAFDGYDGQPVVIWNDRRAIDLLKELGGRGNVFNVFDTHPTRQKQNVKYGSISLVNTVNIINSVDDYQTFMDGLAGNYKDKDGITHYAEDDGQAYRRFPFIIPIRQNDFDLLVNRGVYEDNNAFKQYISYKHLRGNMQDMVNKLGGEKNGKYIDVSSRALKPVVDKHHELEDKYKEREISDEVLDEFKYVGMTPEQIYETEYDDFLTRLVLYRSSSEEIAEWMKKLEYLPSEKKYFISKCYEEYEKRHPKEAEIIEAESDN